MLQQTRVATVIPYYRRFVRAFPTLAHLARAPLERVLELWSGLGYYRRARHLHRAARIVKRKFQGRLPRDYKGLRALPGLGDYTARAILSIAHNLPYTLRDGNVDRVLARLRTVRGNPREPGFRSALEQELARLFSPRQAGNFNQALMELGQTVCLPRAPRCPDCPVRRYCRAYRLKNPEGYPESRLRRSTESHFLAAGIVRRRDRIALVRGLDGGLLGDLWNFPAGFGSSASQALARLRENLVARVRGPLKIGTAVAELRHRITYRDIRVRVYPVKLSGGLVPTRSTRWLPARRLDQSAISQLARKIAARIG